LLLNEARVSWMEFCNIVCTNWAEIGHVFFIAVDCQEFHILIDLRLCNREDFVIWGSVSANYGKWYACKETATRTDI